MLKFKEQDYKSGVSMAAVESLVRKLRLSLEINSEGDVQAIF